MTDHLATCSCPECLMRSVIEEQARTIAELSARAEAAEHALAEARDVLFLIQWTPQHAVLGMCCPSPQVRVISTAGIELSPTDLSTSERVRKWRRTSPGCARV